MTSPLLARCFALVVALVLLPLAGCTVYAAGKPALSTTTSAEQTQRLFWQNVKDGRWRVVQGLLVANVTWRNGQDVLTRDQIVPYLQGLQVKDYLITNVVVKANANEMTVLYDVQLTAGASPQPANLHALAVWQQLPPLPLDATKKQKKQASASPPYLLTVEDLVPVNAPGQ